MLRIDEDHIDDLACKIKELVCNLVDDVKLLENKESDVFMRYMAMMRLHAIFVFGSQGVDVMRHAFSMGFDMHHPFFQTPEAIKKGWDSIKIKKNPFFTQKEPKGKIVELHGEDLPPELKEALLKVLQEKFGNQREDNVH